MNVLKHLFGLRKNKKFEGSLGLDLETSCEKRYSVDSGTQMPTSWEYKKVTEAEKLILECQNIANMFVADYISRKNPKLATFLSQEEPLQESLVKFSQLIPKILSSVPGPIIEALRFKPQIF